MFPEVAMTLELSFFLPVWCWAQIWGFSKLPISPAKSSLPICVVNSNNFEARCSGNPIVKSLSGFAAV